MPAHPLRRPRVKLTALILLGIGGMTAPVWAETGMGAELSDAYEAYERGDFIAAAEQSYTLEAPEAKVLAARSYLAAAGYVARGEGDEARAWLDHVRLATDSALAQEPWNVEALLYRALALGYLSRTMGNWRAHREGLSRQAQALVQRAVELEPDNGWARVVQCGWHAETVSRAGSLLAFVLFGASSKEAIASCERAIEIEPQNLVLRVEYARALLRLSPERFRHTARDQLLIAGNLRAGNRFEELVQEQGRELLAALDSESRERFARVFKAQDAFQR